jgi:hypothetical protein
MPKRKVVWNPRINRYVILEYTRKYGTRIKGVREKR